MILPAVRVRAKSKINLRGKLALEAYEPLFKAKTEGRGFDPDQYLFSAGELAAVARAAIHPDNRQG